MPGWRRRPRRTRWWADCRACRGSARWSALTFRPLSMTSAGLPRPASQCRDRVGAARRQLRRAPASRAHYQSGAARAAQPARPSRVGVLAQSQASGDVARVGRTPRRRDAGNASPWSRLARRLSRILFAVWRDQIGVCRGDRRRRVADAIARARATRRGVSAFRVCDRSDHRHGDCAAPRVWHAAPSVRRFRHRARIEGRPASPTALCTASWLAATTGVWKCGNPQNGFPHSHNALWTGSLTVNSRFIEDTKSIGDERRTCRAARSRGPYRERCRIRRHRLLSLVLSILHHSRYDSPADSRRRDRSAGRRTSKPPCVSGDSVSSMKRRPSVKLVSRVRFSSSFSA